MEPLVASGTMTPFNIHWTEPGLGEIQTRIQQSNKSNKTISGCQQAIQQNKAKQQHETTQRKTRRQPTKLANKLNKPRRKTKPNKQNKRKRTTNWKQTRPNKIKHNRLHIDKESSCYPAGGPAPSQESCLRQSPCASGKLRGRCRPWLESQPLGGHIHHQRLLVRVYNKEHIVT